MDHAYTADNVLVYKLLAYNIPAEANLTDIQKHFEKFGILDEVCFMPNGNKTILQKSAFLLYSNASAAASALRKDNHQICGKCISVKAAKGTQQPKRLISVEEYINNTRNNDSENNTNISILDDWTLEYIMQHLNLRDQLHFAGTCKRLQQIFIKMRRKNLDFNELFDLELFDLRNYFAYAGDSITRVFGQIPKNFRKQIINLLALYCKNIKYFELTKPDLDAKILKRVLFTVPNVVHLNLHNCDINDDALLPLANMYSLESLDLSDNTLISGKHFDTFSTTIQTLNLSGCTRLMPTNVLNFLKTLNNLANLNLINCYYMTDEVYLQMTETTELKNLKISANFAKYEYVTMLPKLERLQIDMSAKYANLREEFFDLLVEHQAAAELKYLTLNDIIDFDDNIAVKISKLEKLSEFHLKCSKICVPLTTAGFLQLSKLKYLQKLTLIDCFGDEINDEVVIQLIIDCAYLRYIYLTHFDKIKIEFIHELIDKLRIQSYGKNYVRNVPLILVIKQNESTKNILKDSKYLNACDLIQIKTYTNFKP